MNLNFKNNFWGYFKFYYNIVGNKLFIYLFLSIAISFLDGLGLAMFMPLLQSVGGDENAGAESLGALQYVVGLIEAMGFSMTISTVLVILVALFILKGAVKFVQMNYQAMLRHLFIKKVRFSLVNELKDLSFRGFLKLDAGRIQNTLTDEVQRVFQTMTFYFQAAQHSAMLITYIFLAFLANYQFAVLVAVGSAISNFLYRRIYIASKKASLQVSSKGHTYNSLMIQAIQHFKYLKSTSYFERYSNKLKQVITDIEGQNRKLGYFAAITTSLKEPIIIIIVCLVIYLQVSVLGSSLGSIVLSLLLFYRALSFLAGVQNNWQMFIQNLGGMNSVATLLDDMAPLKEKPGALPFEEIKKEIVFKNVSFGYNPSTNILNDANVTIGKNKTIALVGESGSGKTTLANMVSGLITPNSGEIFIDNRPLQEYDLRSLRANIGYISQESVIFTDSIFNNITFWDEKTPENMARFENTLKVSSLRGFIDSLPEKEHTQLGDNGILISGGQKQRISIARELYKNADILIFDEATSALDSETERIIQENIEQLHGSYTIILIAHRLSTIRYADTIYLLEKGKVSASGSFDEMVQKSPRFKRMVSLQEF